MTNGENNIQAFAQTNQNVFVWILANTDKNDFANSLHRQILQKGQLSEKQLAAVQRNIDKASTPAPIVQTDILMECFNKAKANGLKRPKLRFNGFEASLAGETSKNAGAVYLKNNDTYLGKIMDGKFQSSFQCNEEQKSAIVATMQDPAEAAIAYGRRTGSCACCGRTLTTKESVERGIGPICYDRYF